jgi:hypothetical protein
MENSRDRCSASSTMRRSRKRIRSTTWRTVCPAPIIRPDHACTECHPAGGDGGGDLQAINTVIDRTVMSWGLPERIKRLALPV